MNNSDIVFEQELKSRGLRFTAQRRAILNTMMENQRKHLSPEEIYDIVKVNSPDIGVATIYRTLLILEDMGLVRKINLDDGKGRYELNKNQEDHHHHHLICEKCGSVSEVKYDLLEQLEEQILKENEFLVTNHSVKFYGYCKDCLESIKNAKCEQC
ncbi:MAG: transcriptional repressor [Clostridiaceae bacterium]|nr:transcriptional repressor [Clostridiaceae bacterium]